MNTRPEAQEAGTGWYCPRCNRAVDGREVTFHEEHEVCGTYIGDVNPPARVASDAPLQTALEAYQDVFDGMPGSHAKAMRHALEALSLPTGDAVELPEGLEACVQHGNSWLAVQVAGKRVVVTVPVEIASAVKRAATRPAEVGGDGVAELVVAAELASATLGHIYHTTPLPPDLERQAHDGYQRLDKAIDAYRGAK